MKKQEKDYSWLLIAIVLGLDILGSMGCKKPATYHIVSINVDRPDTADMLSNNKSISFYSTPAKVGDTILVWYAKDTASNYIIKTIK